MKKNLFLFLLLLVCARRASADGNRSPPDKPIYDQISTYILATGITDHGIVEANETYYYNAHAPVTIPATWDFDPVPEPSTLMLLIPGLLALAALRLKKATA